MRTKQLFWNPVIHAAYAPPVFATVACKVPNYFLSDS